MRYESFSCGRSLFKYKKDLIGSLLLFDFVVTRFG